MSKRNTFLVHKGYLQHRQRIAEIRAKVEHTSPVIHAANFLHLSKLKEDADTYIRTTNENINMLVCLNNLMRTNGVLDTFKHSRSAQLQRSSIQSNRFQILKMQKENEKFGKRLLRAKAKLYTGLDAKVKKKDTPEMTYFKLPQRILAKYADLVRVPSSFEIQQQYLRPKIFLDLEVANLRPLGRIVIQFYTEAAPQIVLEFMRLAVTENKNKLTFLRLFPSLWLEGELKLDYPCSVNKYIEFDKRAIDHGKSAGILSFSLKFVPNFNLNMVNFVISFKPLCSLNGNRVGFGKVIEGMKLLKCVQAYGTKNGKPHHEIVVKQIGLA